MAKIEKTSPHRGIDFDNFLKEQGVFEEVMSSPKIKKAIRDLGDLIQAGEREASFNCLSCAGVALFDWTGFAHRPG